MLTNSMESISKLINFKNSDIPPILKILKYQSLLQINQNKKITNAKFRFDI